MFSTLIRRSCSTIKSIKHTTKSKVTELFRKGRKNSANLRQYTTNAPPAGGFSPVGVGVGALAGFLAYNATDHYKPYWDAKKAFEGPQTYFGYIEDDNKITCYINRKTDDVNKIRKELTASEISTHPYTILWGPCETGKTELVKELASTSGVRYSTYGSFDSYSLEKILRSKTTKTLWEAITRKTIPTAERVERLKDLLLCAADKYKEKHGGIPVLILDKIYVGDAHTDKLIELKQWAIKNSDRIQVVFVPSYSELPNILLGPEEPKKLSLGGFSNDEAKAYLHMKLRTHMSTNNPEWAQLNDSWKTGPSWTQLTRDQVIAKIDDCVDNVIGGDISMLRSISNVNSMETVMGEVKKDAKSWTRWIDPDAAERIYLANGPVPLSTLKAEPESTKLRVNPFDRTVDFAAPAYRKVYEQQRAAKK